MKDMFVLAMEEMQKVEDATREAQFRTLEWACRFGVRKAKKETPAQSGYLRKNYTHIKPIAIMGRITAVMANTSDYASYEEQGHRQKQRFVPGVWRNGRFFYDSRAKEGMMLSEKWVKGSFRLTTISGECHKMIPNIYEAQFAEVCRERGIKL